MLVGNTQSTERVIRDHPQLTSGSAFSCLKEACEESSKGGPTRIKSRALVELGRARNLSKF